jgi:replicative DNA helicase
MAGEPDLPHNVEAEQSLLGALLVNNDIAAHVTIGPEHFYDPVHGRIFEIAMARIEAGKLASPITLRSFMAEDKGLEQLGGPSYLLRLADAAIHIQSAPDLAELINDSAYRRHLMEIGQELIAGASEMNAPIDQVVEHVEEQIADATHKADTKPVVLSHAKGLISGIQAINEAYHEGTGVTGTSTGLRPLDQALGGLPGGSLTTLAGRPSMGKTAVAYAISSSISAEGKGVVYASYEMMQLELSIRWLSMQMRKDGIVAPFSDLRRGKVSEADFRHLTELAHHHQDMPLLTLERDCNTLGKLGGAVRRAQSVLAAQGKELGAVVVDHIGLINVPNTRSELEAITKVTQSLKRMAMSLDVPIIQLSQLNRQVEARDNKRPILSDLRSSGSIEQDSDNVIFCYRDAYYLERAADAETDEIEAANLRSNAYRTRHDLELIVAKNRSGPLSAVRLHCEIGCNYITERDNVASLRDGLL